MDTTAIERWLDAYQKAWRSDAREDIVALFEPDARYYTAPFRPPHVGHEGIVSWWTSLGDSKVEWSFDYDIVAQNGDLFVIRGVTTYPERPGAPVTPEIYDNLWLVTLSPAGKAREFVEFWMLRD